MDSFLVTVLKERGDKNPEKSFRKYNCRSMKTGGIKMTLDELLEYVDRIDSIFQDLTNFYGKAAKRLAMDLVEGLVTEEEIQKVLSGEYKPSVYYLPNDVKRTLLSIATEEELSENETLIELIRDYI